MTDAKPFQVLVIDEKGRVHERLTLTLVIDVYSRVILGFHLGFEAESWSGYCQALRNAMSPKTYLEKLYPDLAGAWPVEGQIETIISYSKIGGPSCRDREGKYAKISVVAEDLQHKK